MYQILSETIEEEHETRLIGDSMIEGQLTEFCGRASHGKRKCMRFPGATVNDITARDDVLAWSDDNTLLILHIGKNDIKASRSEELMEKYKRLIQQYKEKLNNIIMSGILLRMNESDAVYTKAFSTNNRRNLLCALENVKFANFWDNFYNAHHRYQFDGVHLNSVGAASNQVSQFRTKKLHSPTNRERDVKTHRMTNLPESDHIKACYLNARINCNKFSYMEELVATEKFDIIAIAESWLNT